MRTTHSPKQCGFSLIELLIVVAIILVVAAIAIPNYMRSQQAAREASAISSLRSIHSSETAYHSTFGRYGTLSDMNSSRHFIDSSIRDGLKSGYRFSLVLDTNPAVNYEANATPIDTPTVWRHFFVDSTGFIRYEIGSQATSSSAPLK